MKSIFKHILAKLCVLPFMALPAIVFLLDDSFTGGTGIGKTVGFYALMVPIAIAAAGSYLLHRKQLKYATPDALIPVIVVVMLLVTFMWELRWSDRMDVLTLLLVLYVSLRIFLVQRSTNRYYLLLAVMATGLVEASWGLLQLYGGLPSQHTLFNVTGSFFNPGPYAGYLAAVFPLAIFYVYTDYPLVSGTFRKIKSCYYLRWGVALATAVSILLALPATMSRAGWVAAGVGAIAVVLFHRCKTPGALVRQGFPTTSARKTRHVYIVLLLVLSTAMLGFYHMRPDSADGRILIWNIAMKIPKTASLGVGMGSFAGQYGDAQEAYFRSGQGTEREKMLAGEPQYAFNEFVQVLVEGGILSLVLFLFILGYTLSLGIRNGRIAEVGGLTALLIFASVSYPFSNIPFLVLLIIFIASAVSVRYCFTAQSDIGYRYLLNYRRRRRWNSGWIILQLALSAVLSTVCLCRSYPVYQAHKQWSACRILYRTNAYQETIEHYGPLYPYLEDQLDYLFEYSQALFKTGKYEESVEVLAKALCLSGDPMLRILQGKNRIATEDFRLAQYHFLAAAQRVPHRLYPHYMMAVAYETAGETEEALKKARSARVKPVKIESPATREMRDSLSAMIERLTFKRDTLSK